MGKRLISNIIILLGLLHICMGQSAYIQGTAIGAEGKTISVHAFSDQISGEEQRLGSCVVDSNGFFSMDVPLNETIYAWFSIEYYLAEVYLDPGTHHFFELRKIVFNEKTDRVNTNLESLVMQVVPDSQDLLNRNIQQLNVIYNRFLRKNLLGLAEHRIGKDIDSLKMKCDSIFLNYNHSYFRNYLDYRFAGLYLMNGNHKGDGLFGKYLKDRPVLYENIEYMGFLRQYFEDYFMNMGGAVSIDQVRQIVNEQNSWLALLDSAGADPYLVNEILREAVLLESLRNLYCTPGFNRKNILSILEQATEHTKFNEHRLIANNLIENLTRFRAGKPAIPFCLRSALEDTLCSKDLAGKFVYLHFFTTWNVASLEEMEVMRMLYPKYNQSVHFISICCDREYMKMYHFAKEKQYPWPLLHFNNDYDLLHALGVSTYPYFILLDRQGNYVINPAESPSMNIELRLKRVIGEGN